MYVPSYSYNFIHTFKIRYILVILKMLSRVCICFIHICLFSLRRGCALFRFTNKEEICSKGSKKPHTIPVLIPVRDGNEKKAKKKKLLDLSFGRQIRLRSNSHFILREAFCRSSFGERSLLCGRCSLLDGFCMLNAFIQENVRAIASRALFVYAACRRKSGTHQPPHTHTLITHEN